MLKDIHYTALIKKTNMELFEDLKDMYTLLYQKECDYNPLYSIIEFSVNSNNQGDYDIETILYTIDALIVHEDGTYGFCIDNDYIDELSKVYSWKGAGSSAIVDLMTADDKILLVTKYLEKLFNKNIGAIWYRDKMDNKMTPWYKLKVDKEQLFKQDITELKDDKNNIVIKVWLPELVDPKRDLGAYFFVVRDFLAEDDFDEDDMEWERQLLSNGIEAGRGFGPSEDLWGYEWGD